VDSSPKIEQATGFLFKTMEFMRFNNDILGLLLFFNFEVGQSLNDRELWVFVLCGRGLAWSMISACQCNAQQIADDPGNCLNSGSGIQIPAAAPNQAKPHTRRTKILEIV
jgi:hypothetical protein